MNSAATNLARKLVPLEQAAAQHFVSIRTLRRMIARGDITGYRIGPRLIRVDLDEVADKMHPIPAAIPAQRVGRAS